VARRGFWRSYKGRGGEKYREEIKNGSDRKKGTKLRSEGEEEDGG